MSVSPEINLNLHPKQAIALDTEATEVLYGGAAGGGKSHLMRVAAILWCASIPGLQVYLFRRIREDLIKNHMEGPKGFRSVLAPWVLNGFVRIVEDEIRFWNGSKIYLCHCKDEKDIYKYLGVEIHVLLIDELTHFNEAMYRFLRNRVRMVGVDVPKGWEKRFPRILAGSNPGNVGHLFVKRTFVDGTDTYEIRDMEPEEGGMKRQFIPALLEDNPSMGADDPGYDARLRGLGSDALVAAMRYGNWDVVDGAFFDCWDAARHVVSPFTIPDGWTRFRSMDWGSASPFSVGWWAVVGDTVTVSNRTGGKVILPRGCLVRYREWYGASKPNTGLKMENEDIGRGIAAREKGERITYGVLDPACFSSNGGPSIHEQIMRGGPIFREADNARVAKRGAIGGWSEMRGRLIGDADRNPMIVCFATCHDSIRTVPALQHDSVNPEDIDTDMEDHCFAAGTMVETDKGPVAIEKLPPTGWVHSRDGIEKYRSARLTRRDAEIVRVMFANGAVVECTKDHKFLVDRNEWRYAKDLTDLEVLCAPSLSARRSRNSMESDTTFAANTFSVRERGFISRFGYIITALCRSASMSIMPTMTGPTTIQEISNASRSWSTWAAGMERKAAHGGAKALSAPVLLLQSGTELRRADNGTRNISKSTSGQRWRDAFRQFATNAAVNTWLALPRSCKVNSADRIAERVRCVGVEEAGRADVYCITVPKTGCFAIEGGLIVSNCADEWRYACMSRPWVRKQTEVKKPLRNDYGSAAANETSWRM